MIDINDLSIEEMLQVYDFVRSIEAGRDIISRSA